MTKTSRNTVLYLPSMLVSQRARSSFIGSRLASCLLANHRLYCCKSVRPGPNGCCFGLRELHMAALLHWPKNREQSKCCKKFLRVRTVKKKNNYLLINCLLQLIFFLALAKDKISGYIFLCIKMHLFCTYIFLTTHKPVLI